MLEGVATIAVPTGTVADQFVLDRFPDAEIVYFNSVLDCALAVKDGKAAAAAYDKPILKNIASKQDGLIVLDELLIDDEYGFAVKIENQQLKKAIDETLTEIKANGTYNEMQTRWFPEKGTLGPMPAIESMPTNGVLRVFF
jgi:polar amino acid transport system substrate-binding protein